MHERYPLKGSPMDISLAIVLTLIGLLMTGGALFFVVLLRERQASRRQLRDSAEKSIRQGRVGSP
jgi:hypothetical protein